MTQTTSLSFIGAAFAFAFFSDAMTEFAVWVHCFAEGDCTKDKPPEISVRYAGFGVGAMATIFFAAWAAQSNIRTRTQAVGIVLALVAGGLWTILKIGTGDGFYPPLGTLFAPLGVYMATAAVFTLPLFLRGKEGLSLVAALAACTLLALGLSALVFDVVMPQADRDAYVLKPYAVAATTAPWAILIATLWRDGKDSRRAALLTGAMALLIAIGYGFSSEFDEETAGRSILFGPLLSVTVLILPLASGVLLLVVSGTIRRASLVLLFTVFSAASAVFVAMTINHMACDPNCWNLAVNQGLAVLLSIFSAVAAQAIVVFLFAPQNSKNVVSSN